MPSSASSPAAGLRPLRLGYVPLTDAAPLIVAAARGLFTRHGLRVKLSREVGWATIRDKLFHGELDAAPVLAPMLWAAQLGLGSPAFPVCTALVLSLNGNAITLSTALRAAGVTDVATLRTEARQRRGERRLTFGVVHPFSSHHLLLRAWLKAGNLEPDRDVRIAIVPPAQMFRNLVAGTIDGYCVGEPWNSVAVAAKAGWCAPPERRAVAGAPGEGAHGAAQLRREISAGARGGSSWPPWPRPQPGATSRGIAPSWPGSWPRPNA